MYLVRTEAQKLGAPSLNIISKSMKSEIFTKSQNVVIGYGIGRYGQPSLVNWVLAPVMIQGNWDK